MQYNQRTRLYDDGNEKEAHHETSELPYKYITYGRMPASCPSEGLQITQNCTDWHVGGEQVEAATNLRQNPTRLNYPNRGQVALHGTAPLMARGGYDINQNTHLRDGTFNQHSRSDIAEADFTPLRFFDLSQCTVPHVESGRRGGASTRSDLRNHLTCRGQGQ